MRFLTCKGKDKLLNRLYMIINASPRVVTKYKRRGSFSSCDFITTLTVMETSNSRT